jgi:hypothetical protein
MTRSDTINELAAALAQAQAAMGHAKKDSENPHYRSKYADLAAIWDACRPALSANSLSIVQSPRLVSVGDGVWLLEVETLLLHSSGQWLADTLAVPVSAASPQAVGSAITYAKRYSLASFVGVAPAGDDDDGNSAIELPTRQLREPPKGKIVPPKPAKADGPGSVTVKVLGVVQRPMSDGRVKFIVSGDDHKTYSSLDLAHATVAKDAQSAGLPVAIAYLATDEGRIIQSLKELEAPL